MEIICYLSNGYPTLKDSHKLALAYAEAGCSIIEVDFPSADPYLESEYIAGRMKKALTACSDYEQYMREIVQLKQEIPEVKLLVLSYENTILQIGVNCFIEFCLQNGLKDILLVGLKDESVKEQLIAAGLLVSCYVQFHMPADEIESARKSNGFVYMQAKPYEDQKVNEKYPHLADCISYLRECGIDRPIYCGVGVHTPKDVRIVREAGGDAAFVGSAILKQSDNPEIMMETIRKFKAQCE